MKNVDLIGRHVAYATGPRWFPFYPLVTSQLARSPSCCISSSLKGTDVPGQTLSDDRLHSMAKPLACLDSVSVSWSAGL